MSKPRAYLELFAGGAACALALTGGTHVMPPVGYMGGKRRLAPAILGAAGLTPGQGAGAVLLVDAGEWGNVWSEVATRAQDLAELLASWRGRDPSELWQELAQAGRPDDPTHRAAAYLWLQGRSASCTPVWWADTGAERLVMPSNGSHGPGLISAHEKPARLVMADKPGRPPQRPQETHPSDATREVKEKGRRSAGSGVMRPATVAHRVLQASVALRTGGGVVRVERAHPTAADVATWLGTPEDLQGVVAVLDPPYVGATRYEATCPREEVARLAEEYAALGALVLVCEAEPLPELLTRGWHGVDLREATSTGGKPEWLTMSSPARGQISRQLRLWSAA